MSIIPHMPPKILLADDNPNILSFVQPALEREGYTVVTAADGAEALYKWETEHPALLILDIEMPDPNGLAVCRKIRDAGDTVPIIFLTVRDSVSDLEFGFSLGASDYMPKPFDIRELLARVKARLPRAVQEFDNYLRVDTLRRVVSVKRDSGWEAADLTPREFDLLNYLVTNAGRPLSRTALLEAVFDIPGDSDIETKTLEKHIWALRQKIEPNPKEPRYLVNVRGVGYKFDVS
ncbi:MAG: response regulator transcription factor [Chloroflexi bacterium]|nr:response regulator transcription factor [Chloroflexota bacterium]